jgi:hypothetical protein
MIEALTAALSFVMPVAKDAMRLASSIYGSILYYLYAAEQY